MLFRHVPIVHNMIHKNMGTDIDQAQWDIREKAIE